jgi:hypothetical protein
MRFLRVILSGLAVVAALIAGLFVTVTVALAGLVIFAARRLFGPPAPTPAAQDAIEVVTTEVRGSEAKPQ